MFSYLKHLYLEDAYSKIKKLAANEVGKFKNEGEYPDDSIIKKYISSKFFFKNQLSRIATIECTRLIRYRQLYIDVKELHSLVQSIDAELPAFEKIFIKIITNIDGYPNDIPAITEQLIILLKKQCVSQEDFSSILIRMKTLILRTKNLKSFYYALH